MNLTHVYISDLCDYVIPDYILAAAGVTTPRSLWDRRFGAAKRIELWGKWMDRCEMSK